MDSLTYSIVCGLLSLLGFGIGNAMAQTPIKKIGPIQTTFMRAVFSSFFLFIALLFFVDVTSLLLLHIAIGVGVGFLSYIPLMFFYSALQKGKVGIIAPIGNSFVLFVVLLSVYFFNETLSVPQIIFIALIVLGVILSSINFKDLKNSHLFSIKSGIPAAIAASISWGIAIFLFRFPVILLGPFLTAFLIEFCVMIAAGTHLFFSAHSFKKIKKQDMKHLALIGVFIAAATFFFNFGISKGSLSIVTAFSSAAPIASILYGRFVYDDSLSVLQYISISLIVIGIVVLSAF